MLSTAAVPEPYFLHQGSTGHGSGEGAAWPLSHGDAGGSCLPSSARVPALAAPSSAPGAPTAPMAKPAPPAWGHVLPKQPHASRRGPASSSLVLCPRLTNGNGTTNRAASYPCGDIVPSTKRLSLCGAHTHQQFAWRFPAVTQPPTPLPPLLPGQLALGTLPGSPRQPQPQPLPQTALGSEGTPQCLSPCRGPAGLGESAEQEPRALASLLTWCLVCGCALSLFGGCTCTSLCIVPMGVGWGHDKDKVSHGTAALPPPRASPSNLWPNKRNTPELEPLPAPQQPQAGCVSPTAESGVTTGLGSPQLQEPPIPATAPARSGCWVR